jgi:FlaA1/EpsC-like NDP-sugar epimerase
MPGPSALRRRAARAAQAGNFGHLRFAISAGLDGLSWIAAMAIVAVVLRRDLATPPSWPPILGFGLLAAAIDIIVGTRFGLFVGRWLIGSFDEFKAVVATAACTTAAVFVADLVAGTPVPHSVVIGAGCVALLASAGTRMTYRSLVETTWRSLSDAKERLLVFGAGDAGYRIVRELQRDPTGAYQVVGVLDDNPRKRNRRVHGVAMAGDRTAIAAAAERLDADGLLIAIPSASPSLVAQLTELGEAAGLRLMTVPSIGQLISSEATPAIRDVTDEDLLGRRRVETDLVSIAHYITGKRVLVTGAGGSIGSELCRQLVAFGPAELIMADRDESALHAVQMSLEQRALLDSDRLVLIDIRDRVGVHRLFEQRKPEVVFHAAALKHLPLLERYPVEALKTNVWGTQALLEAAARHGVERFVNISTDKAASPQSVLGYSKRVCERLTARFAAETGRAYLSVRFGNVLGSRGSMLGAFQAQVAAGGPITVTHPDVTRYFMTVEEAVQLVIQAGAIGRPGEALVLDMGEPVRILDVAKMLASRSGRPIEIVFTGLRPGEKLTEQLMASGEVGARSVHPSITHVDVPELDPELINHLDPFTPSELLVPMLRELALEGDPNSRQREHQPREYAVGGGE